MKNKVKVAKESKIDLANMNILSPQGQKKIKGGDSGGPMVWPGG